MGPGRAARRRGSPAPSSLLPSGPRRLTSAGTGRFSAAAFSSNTESVCRSLRGAAGCGRRSHRHRRSRTSLPDGSGVGGSAILLGRGRGGETRTGAGPERDVASGVGKHGGRCSVASRGEGGREWRPLPGRRSHGGKGGRPPF